MLDERANVHLTAERANLLVVVSVATEEDCYLTGVSLDERRRDLRVVSSGRRHVQLEDFIRSRVHERGWLSDTSYPSVP